MFISIEGYLEKSNYGNPRTVILIDISKVSAIDMGPPNMEQMSRILVDGKFINEISRQDIDKILTALKIIDRDNKIEEILN